MEKPSQVFHNFLLGIMTTNSLMDGAIIGSYTLVLQVEDGGNDAIRSATQTLSVTVTSTSPNYNDPVFAAATADVITVTLARAATIGTTVATALATDTDNSNSGVVEHKVSFFIIAMRKTHHKTSLLYSPFFIH